ncbi:RluA family pseudouridine synthase [Viscerimonas tarda]
MNNKPENTVLQSFKVTAKAELLTFLEDKQVRKSRNAVKSLLAHKQVKVNKKIVSQYNYELKPEDVVSIHKKNQAHNAQKLKGLSIIYEDESLIVIDKEAGLLSIATDREKRETAYSIISEYLKHKDKEARIFVLHRLDRETSGLMMYAKETDVQEIMQKNWDNFIKVRSYIAVVEGEVAPAEGTIVSWLTEDKNYVMHSSPRDNGGQKSITHYKTLKTNRKFSMLVMKLETGRKNQIRVHLQHVGHPIVGDKKYGSKISAIKRLALHAQELTFMHPLTNEILEFKSPIPKKMQMLVE